MLKFSGGIRPDEHKYTKNAEVVSILPPDTLSVYTYGDASCVEVGSEVYIGSPLTFSFKAHSPVCGIVTDIKDEYVIIENNGGSAIYPYCVPFNKRLADASFKDIETFTRERGIKCGDDFLADRLASAKNDNVKFLVIGCGETAPFECSSYRLFKEKFDEILYGAKIVMKALGITKVAFALEKHRKDDIRKLNSIALKQNWLKVIPHSSKYPADDDSVIAASFFKTYRSSVKSEREVFVVSAKEAYELYTAFRTGLPQISLLITVDGTSVHSPKNLRVPVGIKAADVLKECETDFDSVNCVIFGNTLKGRDACLDSVVNKGVSSVLAFDEEFWHGEARECISCGRCVKHCPVKLDPSKLHEDGAFSEKCISCGICSYVCPSFIDFSCIHSEKEDEL